ncbi:efflux RND transporter permease subunit [Rubrivirga sp. S365]|uniref:efflux RND transporter permease subunit n=1 Tax=Rubrivirga sp. S365 TaxID=3076080 RepID=UPI0028C9F35F|nr:efflux RND transporter permease subunit [Rubrivirga sp. S365]MDT7858238.1 efflux RND transporter permease subunit [Rubrivirga sp. S365]
MLERLIEWSARNRLLVGLVTLMVAALGTWATLNTPVDAIPDLSDVQVIIKTEYAGQGPQIVEEQVTYPLTSALLSVPYAKTVRGYSMFGTSFVYVIFEDGTDMYWARSRVLEYLSQIQDRLPESATPALGPDATGVGWVYQYSLRDTTGTYDLAQLRSVQDFYLKYELQAVEGVAEVATVGGFQKQYQVVVDPQRLAAYGIPLSHVGMALKRSNRDVGGRLLELGEREFIVRGKGYLRGVDDIRQVVVKAEGGTPVTVGQVAEVRLGPEIRRGIADVNGEGEVVGGIVVMRSGENAQATIEAVKARIAELDSGLPPGVEVVTEYDRSPLIGRAVSALSTTIWEEMLVVALVVMVFLLHVRSAFVALVTVPVGILIALGVMYLLGINANIMSLGGIAIAIGVMVDASLVMVENAHKHIERAREAKAARRGGARGPAAAVDPGLLDAPRSGDGGGGPAPGLGARVRAWFARAQRRLDRVGGGTPELTEGERVHAVIEAAKEVGPSLFFSLLIVTVSFLPVFTLEAVEGRMFRPLALTKTFSMAAAAVLAVTLVPALMAVFVKGKIRSEQQNPIARFFIRAYRPVIRGTLRHPRAVLVVGFSLLLVTVLPVQRLLLGETYVPFPQIGSEFMPPLWEGDMLYMPTTLPGVSPQEAKNILQRTDRIIASFPEVERVFGKIGRAETATDPAPLSMIETTIILKPEDQWREGMTRERLTAEMDAAIQFPGLTNAWTMPIKTRIDMLATGIKTPVGVKIAGEDLETLERLGQEVERAVAALPGTRSAFAERVMGGSFLDVEVDRFAAARYGLTSSDVQDVLQAAVGGMNVTTTVEGLERYPVNVRYPRALRDDLPALRQVLVPTPSGAQIPLGELATFAFAKGPPMIKSENARPNAWVFVDIEDSADVGSYVQDAQAAVAAAVDLPPGYSLRWSGQYEYMERANRRLAVLVPIALAIVFILLFLHFRSAEEALLLMIPLPFAVVGAVWLMLALGYNMSIAVGVGLIAVAGLAAETGVVMHVYLDEAVKRYRSTGRLTSVPRLKAALEEGAVDRVRPKLMTVFTTILGLTPLMIGTGTGAEVMQRIATPMIGGLVTSTVHTLVMIPALYAVVQGRRLRRELREHAAAPDFALEPLAPGASAHDSHPAR